MLYAFVMKDPPGIGNILVVMVDYIQHVLNKYTLLAHECATAFRLDTATCMVYIYREVQNVGILKCQRETSTFPSDKEVQHRYFSIQHATWGPTTLRWYEDVIEISGQKQPPNGLATV